MYHLLGFQESVRNLLLLGLQARPGGSFETLAEVAAAYRDYLSERQSRATLGEAAPGAGPTFLTERSAARALLEFYLVKDPVIDDGPVTAVELQCAALAGDPGAAAIRLEQGAASLAGVDPSLHDLLKAAIIVVFLYPSATRGGGSTPRAVGLIWANPSDSWTPVDLQEFFVHELTHNLLFIDERCRPHYLDHKRLADPSTYVESSIRKTPRRADLAFHSLVVAVEVLLFRQRHGLDAAPRRLHPPTGDLLASARRTAAALEARQAETTLLADRTVQLLGACIRALETLS